MLYFQELGAKNTCLLWCHKGHKGMETSLWFAGGPTAGLLPLPVPPRLQKRGAEDSSPQTDGSPWLIRSTNRRRHRFWASLTKSQTVFQMVLFFFPHPLAKTFIFLAPDTNKWLQGPLCWKLAASLHIVIRAYWGGCRLEFQEESVHFMALIAFRPSLQDTDYC